jgi:hypothetical protein
VILKRDLIIAVLATFCLTATLFMILPAESSPAEYDPWADLNDDGTINILDVANVALVFGTSGDPTKNVNITNLPSQYEEFSFTLNISWVDYWSQIYWSPSIPASHSRIFITMSPIGISEGVDASVNVTLRDIAWAPTYSVGSVDYGEESPYETLEISRFDTTHFAWNRPIPYETKSKSPYFKMVFYVHSTVPSGWILTEVYVYLRNE